MLSIFVSRGREVQMPAELPPEHPRNCRHTLVLRSVGGVRREFLFVLTPAPEPEIVVYYRGLNNYQYYFGGFLIISIVQWAPKPYSEKLGPYTKSFNCLIVALIDPFKGTPF